MEVQVRGPKDTLEGIKINECVSIDLKDYVEPGIYDVPVTVKTSGTLYIGKVGDSIDRIKGIRDTSIKTGR